MDTMPWDTFAVSCLSSCGRNYDEAVMPRFSLDTKKLLSYADVKESEYV
jgi:hypothetical protein